MRVDQIIQYHATARPDVKALVQDELTLSFAGLESAIRQVANGLTGLGVAKNDRVAIVSENNRDAVLLILAAAKIGAVAVPVNNRLAAPELSYILEDCHAKVVVVPDAGLVPLVASLALSMQPRLLGAGQQLPEGWLEWPVFWSQQSNLNPADTTDVSDAFIQLYTSGTTGRPKGVVISHRNLVDLSMSGVIAAEQRLAVGEKELVMAPLFHVGAIASLFNALMLGVTVIVQRNFKPQSVVEAIEQHRLKSLFMVPAMIQAIINSVPDLEQRDFSSLRRINYGASPIAEGLLKQALGIFSCDFQQSYGMTEAAGAFCQLTVADHKRALAGRPELLRSCGRPTASAQMKVVDGDGEVVTDGELGELLVKSTTVMLGYWNLPDETAGTIRNGWLHTGDIGYRDQDGYFYLKDRKKDVVVSGGENIYPNEVERVLLLHPSVADVAVIGIPDEKFGEAVLACCVLSSAGEIDQEVLITHCREYLAGYKIPRQYKAFDELPRNPSGKVLKNCLREPYWQGRDRNIA